MCTFFSPGPGMSAPVPTPGACIPPRCCSQRMPAQKVTGRGCCSLRGDEGRTLLLLSPQKRLCRAGRAGQGRAHVRCRVFTKHCSRPEGMAGIHPLAPPQTPRTCRRTRGIRSSSLLPWLHISDTQAAKKIKEENQNISMGGKKNRRGKNAEE